MTGCKKIVFCLIAVTMLGLTGTAFAHPPKSLNLSWNPNGTLTVTVDHSVNDPQKHFINKITIYVNDKIVINKEYQAQENESGFTATFPIGTQPSGTIVKAEAFCIIMGSNTGSLTVP